MRKIAVAALILVLVAGGAEAAALRGELRASHVAVDGPFVAMSRVGALDLAPGPGEVDAVRLTWAAASGREVQSTWDHLAPDVALQGPVDNHTVTWEAGSLDALRCRGPLCSVLVVSSTSAAELWIRGNASGGEMAGSSQPASYHAGFSEDGSNSFRFIAEREWPRVGGSSPTSALTLSDTRAWAQGDMDLFLDDVGGTLHSSAGSRDLVTGNTSSPSPKFPASDRVTHTWLVVHLQGARVEAEGAHLLLLAPALQAEMSTLALTDAHGWFDVGGRRTFVDSESVVLEGDVHAAANGARELRLDGAVDNAYVSGAVVVDDPIVTFSPAQATGWLVAALVVISVWRFWWPLYSRIDPGNVLDNENRRRVLEAARRAPGASVSQIARELGMSGAIVAYHLRRLERAGAVTTATHGRVRVAFTSGQSPDEIVARLLLADPTRRKIANLLMVSPATQTELVARAGMSQRLASYHLAQLGRAGLLQQEGRPAKYSPTQRLRGLIDAQE